MHGKRSQNSVYLEVQNVSLKAHIMADIALNLDLDVGYTRAC